MWPILIKTCFRARFPIWRTFYWICFVNRNNLLSAARNRLWTARKSVSLLTWILMQIIDVWDQNIPWIFWNSCNIKIPQFEDFSRWTPTPGPQSLQTPPLLPQCLLLIFLSGWSRCRQRWDQALPLCSPGSWSPGVPAEGLKNAELVQGNILVS